VLGALLVLSGVVWLIQRAGILHLSWETMLSALLIALGVGMVMTARRPRGRGLLLLGVTLTLLLAGTSSVDVGLAKDGVGDRSLHPASVLTAKRDTSLGVGHLEVDLRDLTVPVGETTLHYRIGIGEMIVRLPTDERVAVRVNASARGGELTVLGRVASGSNVTLPYSDPNYATAERHLVLDLSAGLASVQVERGG
jgi:predicted membrane protein